MELQCVFGAGVQMEAHCLMKAQGMDRVEMIFLSEPGAKALPLLFSKVGCPSPSVLL
jgi:hypothetical protein